MRRRHVLQILPLAIAGLHLAPVRGQAPGTFPEPGKPIRLVVPFPAGGTSDLRARQVAEHLRQDAGWTVVVDNRPGASGMIGSDLVAKAPADGYTLLLGTIGTLAINPAVFPAQPYNVLHDFQPVTQFSRSVSVLMAHKQLGHQRRWRSWRPPRAPANRLAYASTGTGTIGHMVGEVYKKRANLELTHVPYKGTAPAVQDFVAGHVPLLVETPSAVWEHLKAGTAVPLAVTSSARMPQMPSVPTFKELGYADIVFDTWQGIVTRRGVPPAVLEALNRELVKALRSPDVVRSHEEQVNVVVANTPEQFERFIADETRKWTSVVKETGVAAG
jgi:tripartite-type tricarboxylate transporter receptor subunit TctC